MFLNTDSRFYAFDALHEADRRPLFLGRYLPDFDITPVTEAGWRRLVRLRDAIRAVLTDADPEAARRLTAVAHGYPSVLQVEEAGAVPRLTVAPVRDHDEQAIAVAVLAALEAAARDGRLARLRFCQRPECGWCFYDGTKNRSGRWCSSDPCGDVMKARAYRRRQRAAVGDAGDPPA
jgi:predicted RNA-binding Zn ribbon-like protein